MPPIDDEKLKEFSVDHDDEGYFRFTQESGDEEVTIVDGQVAVVGTNPGRTVVEFGYHDGVKAYDFPEVTERLAQLCEKEGAVFNALFYGDGEESDDYWRLDVTNNQVKQEESERMFASDLAECRSEAWQLAHDQLCHYGRNCSTHKNPYAP